MNNRIIMPAALILLILLCFSCVSTDDEVGTEGVPVSVYSTPIDFSTDIRRDLLNTLPINGKPRFFASVQRLADREQELPAALLQASQQASKFVAVKALSKFYSEKLNSSMKYMRDLDVIWDRDLALEMIDQLEVIEIHQDTYGTYIIAELPTYSIKQPAWVNSSTGSTPEWTSRIPEIPGYIASVGVALQTGYVADSFEASDNQALEDLSRQISVEIVTGKKQIVNSVGTATLNSNYESSEVVIPGFYILARWRTPDSRYYYSLGIAPMPQP